MRPILPTHHLLAVLADERDADAVLARAGLRAEEITRLTGRPATAELEPLPFWFEQLRGGANRTHAMSARQRELAYGARDS